ncbi:unnamed protein product [Vicia faba]|uniref:Cyclin-dependent kinase inhibitor domain-containing protein n=1 Tax=Vicia faba TaxID=3906 RepID=A0AAV1AF34_VICFA|nr:unnamed protein product [Vicia faba]
MNMPNLGRKRKTSENFHHNKPPFKKFTFINMVDECISTLTSDEESFPCSCSSNIINKFEEHQVVQTPDQVETSTCDNQVIRRREMSLLSEEEEVGSIEKKPQKTPSESELDEFFSAAEENIQKQFENKYNFDIVKDMPLEGRYEWVQLKQ